MPKGDAENWSIGDMKADQEKIEYEITAQQPYSTEAEAERVAAKLRSAAVKNKTGALVDVVPDKRSRSGAYIVRVHNPKGKKR